MDDEAVEVPAAVDGAAHDEEADEGPDDRFVVQGAMEGPFRDDPVVANGPAARLACMSVLLTFAGLYVNELSHEQLIEHLTALCPGGRGYVEYVVCLELHKTPADPMRPHHYHVYIKSANRFDTLDPRYFDLQGHHQRVLHPHIQVMGRSAADRDRVISYLLKEGNVRMDISRGGPFNLTTRRAELPTWGERVRDAPTPKAAEETLRKHDPQIHYKYGDTIYKRKRKECSHDADVGETFKMSSFRRAPLNLDKPVVLFGNSGVGKTAFALAHFKTPLFCSCKEDLKDLTSHHDGIVFDDMDFSSLTPEQAIAILDIAHPRRISCRYANASIPAGMRRIFTSNRLPANIFPKPRGEQQRAALKRRYNAVCVQEKLYNGGEAEAGNEYGYAE